MGLAALVRRTILGMALAAGCAPKEPEPEVHVTRQFTDSQGRAYFTDAGNGERVEIIVLNDNKAPVPEAEVLFFDGEGMECFRPYHPQYTPGAVACYEHNSTHTIRLTAHPLQVVQPRDSEEIATRKLLDWTEAGWEDYGCRDKQEIEQLMETGSYIMDFVSNIFSLGITKGYYDKTKEFLTSQIDNDLVGHIYFFNPSAHGFRATSTIWTMDFRRGSCKGGEYTPPRDAGTTGYDDGSPSYDLGSEKPDAGNPPIDMTVKTNIRELCALYQERYWDECGKEGQPPGFIEMLVYGCYNKYDQEELEQNRELYECSAAAPDCTAFFECLK